MEERRKTRAKGLVRSCAKSQTSFGRRVAGAESVCVETNGDHLSEPCREVAVGIV